VASYVGLSTIRTCGMGPDMRDPTSAELEKEKSLVEAAMKQGALGLSSGLIYPPGSYAKTPEIVELAKVASQYGGIYTTHMRSEGDHLLDAINETLTIGEQAHLPVHILHIKSNGEASNARARDAIDRINDARARGIEVTADQYPYIASSTGLTTTLPQWVQDGGTGKMLQRLRDPESRAKVREAIVNRRGVGYDQMVVAAVRSDANRRFEGHNIAEVAQMRNQEPPDAIMDTLLEEGGRVSMVFYSMKEDDVRLFMQQPWVSFGSDGTSVRPDGPLGRGKPHPRFYGSNVRVLGRYVREEKVLTLADAVRKMTSLAAEQLGIHDRGLLAEGMKADVVVFDPDRVIDKATFQDPHQYAEGVNYVVVNGTVVIEEGKHTGKKPGQVIYGAGRVTTNKPNKTGK
jgi:N-acyl-D-amino-acid deacylase